MIYWKKFKQLMVIAFIAILSSTLVFAKSLEVINKTSSPVTLEIKGTETVLESQKSLRISMPSSVNITYKRYYIELQDFLEDNEKLTVTIEPKVDLFSYSGDKMQLYDYIYNQLGKDFNRAINNYQLLESQNNIARFITTSEDVLNHALKNANLKSIQPSPDDSENIKWLKHKILWNWSSSIFTSLNIKKSKDFCQKLMRYYVENYLKEAVVSYDCSSTQRRSYTKIIKTIVNLKLEKEFNLPTFDVVEPSESEKYLKYLPTKCQADVFYLNWLFPQTPSQMKVYYKDVLMKKFGYFQKYFD